MSDSHSTGAAPAPDPCIGAVTEPSMIGILIIAHDSFGEGLRAGRLGEGLAHAVTHVLGSRPPQFEVLSVAATDDPLMLLPAARELVSQLDTGTGVLVFSDIYGASPCNLVGKLLKPGRVEGIAGVNLPMLVRAMDQPSFSLPTRFATGTRTSSRNTAASGVRPMLIRS